MSLEEGVLGRRVMHEVFQQVGVRPVWIKRLKRSARSRENGEQVGELGEDGGCSTRARKTRWWRPSGPQLLETGYFLMMS